MAPQFMVLNFHHLKSHAIFLRRSPSIQRRIHMGDSQSPVFSASPVLIHISQPEKRLVNGGWLLVYSVK
jgi:hypothetical protein